MNNHLIEIIITELTTPFIHRYIEDDQRLSAIKQVADEIIGTRNPRFCISAARANHIKSLQYLHEILGCPISEDTMYYAVQPYGIHCL